MVRTVSRWARQLARAPAALATRLALAAALALGSAAVNAAAAQTPPADTMPRPMARGDSIRPRPPVSPTGAFLRSLVLPGWGQSRLNRNVTGGLFVAFEALAVTMVWKSEWQLDWARTRNKFVREHTQEREDWITLLLFNHLMAAAEAYVSAHLYDFPAALKLERAHGGVQVGLSISFR
jgi:hypothetical protein